VFYATDKCLLPAYHNHHITMFRECLQLRYPGHTQDGGHEQQVIRAYGKSMAWGGRGEAPRSNLRRGWLAPVASSATPGRQCSGYWPQWAPIAPHTGDLVRAAAMIAQDSVVPPFTLWSTTIRWTITTQLACYSWQVKRQRCDCPGVNL
jgi:hypothetical protein